MKSLKTTSLERLVTLGQVLSRVCQPRAFLLAAFIVLAGFPIAPANDVASAQGVAAVADGLLTFTSTRDGNAEIYVMNGTGFIGPKPTRLTDNPAVDRQPAWSPDGTMIAFASDRAGNFDVYVMNEVGGEQTALTSDLALDADPAWSPDGSQLVFTSSRDGNLEIYKMNADGSGQTRLTNNAATDHEPAWSPDGTKIAFRSDRDGNGEIYLMNADGSGSATNLTNDAGNDGAPDWAPDGSQITFHTDRGGNLDIYKMNADGSGQTNLSNNAAQDGSPAWSSDGTKIAFSSDRGGDDDIYWVDQANSMSQTNIPESANSATDIEPDWQPFLVVADLALHPFLVKWGSPCILQPTPPDPVPDPGCADPDGAGPLQVGDGQFFGPLGIAIDANSNVYVAGSDNSRIQKFDRNGVFLTKWGGSGIGDGQFGAGPGAVAVDASGNVYADDNGLDRIHKFDSNGTFLGWMGKCTGPLTGGKCDTINQRTNGFSCDASCTGAGAGEGDGQFNEIAGIDIDGSGNFYVGDALNHRIQKFASDGSFLGWTGKCTGPLMGGNCDTVNQRAKGYSCTAATCTVDGPRTAAGSGSGDGQFLGLANLAVSPDGEVYATSALVHRVQKFASDGSFAGWGGRCVTGANCDEAKQRSSGFACTATTCEGLSAGVRDGQFNYGLAIDVDSVGTVYVAGSADISPPARVQEFDASGTFLGSWGSPCVLDTFGIPGAFVPSTVCADLDGAGPLEVGDGQFYVPHGIEVDANGDVYLVDSGNSRVQRFGPRPVGGIAELPDAATSPVEADGSSELSAGLLVGVAVAGALAFGGAAWYARRRWA